MVCLYACCLSGFMLDAVARIALVKPDKARGIENMVLQMAQRGQLTEKVGIIHHKASNNARDTVEALMSCARIRGLLQLTDAVAAAQMEAADLTAPRSLFGSCAPEGSDTLPP